MRRLPVTKAVAVAGLCASTVIASAQGVPIIDGNLLKQNLAILTEQERDLGRQQGKLSRAEAQLQLDAEIIAELDKLIDAGSLPAENTTDMVQTLEDGAGQPAASVENLYNPQDKNPAADKTFGDAALTVEEVIIAGAKATYSHAGVSKAGLSQAQWRALLQAMIWQESRFNPFIGSHVGAWGLTQLMPGTAKEVGVAGTIGPILIRRSWAGPPISRACCRCSTATLSFRLRPTTQGRGTSRNMAACRPSRKHSTTSR